MYTMSDCMQSIIVYMLHHLKFGGQLDMGLCLV